MKVANMRTTAYWFIECTKKSKFHGPKVAANSETYVRLSEFNFL